MPGERGSEGRTFLSAEQQQQMREQAKAAARARIAAQQAAATNAPEAPRSRPAPAPRQTPPHYAPGSGPQPAVRRTTQSRPLVQGQAGPISGEQPHFQLQHAPEEPAPRKGAASPEADEAPRKTKRRGRTVALSLAAVAVLTGGGKVAWDSNVGGINDKVSTIDLPAGPKTAESEYGDIIAPAVTGAEGFNMQNCKAEGSEIASLRITTGHYAMRYLLQLGEDPAPVVQPPYLTEANMGENQEFVTESGYPEMTIHDVVMSIHACQKEGASAVETNADGIIINKNNLDFTATLTIPTAAGLMQTEAYMTDIADDVPYTYPRDWLPVVDPENTDALKPARDVHFTAPQMQGVFNAAIQTAVAGASTASEGEFFGSEDDKKDVRFIGTDNRTLYSAIDEGLRQRVGSGKVDITGMVNAITPELPNADAKAALIDTTGNPNSTFTLVEGEVIVGHYAEEEEK